MLLTLGLYPVLDQGKLDLAVTRTMADSWGDEGGWPSDEDIYNSMSDVFGMDIIGSSEWMGHTVFNLADGSIWDPSSGNLDEVEIQGFKEDIINAFPELFPPDTPEADPGYYPSLEELIVYVERYKDEPPPEKKDPCDAAKDLTQALNDALATQDVQDMMTALKGTVNSSVEHGFLITKDASGFHVTPMETGTATSVQFTTDASTNVVFVVHVHPPNASAAPSSTDIYGLNDYGADFEGSIILHGNDMYLMSITDEAAYDKFNLKSNQKGYYDKDSPSGWKEKSSIDDEFDSFSRDYTELYKGVDATYPTQLHLMERFNMGITLQKWDPAANKFSPEDVSAEYNNNTGSSTTIGGGGNQINSRYKKIEVNKVNCPDN